MPSFDEAAKTIRERFKTEFHALRDAPIAFDNVEGLIDSNGNLIQEATDGNGNPVPWVRLSIRLGNASQITAGRKRRFRQRGAIIVQIFVPTGNGDGVAYRIADDVAAALRGVTVSGVRMRATSAPQFVGPDGQWWQANSNTPVDFDTID